MIRPALLLCCLSLIAGLVSAQSGPNLRLEISGLADVEGNLYLSVYDSEETWLGDDTALAAKLVIAEAREGELVVTELSLPQGNYAFSIYYDANGNGELDTNFIGIPREPVALSNNARPRFGPPKYRDAVFAVGEEPVRQQVSIEAI